MRKTKLIQLLLTFSNNELRKFGEYLESPYFNRNEKLPVLFRVIQEVFFYLKLDNLTKEQLWSKAFPGKNFDDTQFRLLASEVLKHAENFLAVESLFKDQPMLLRQTLTEMQRRDLEKHFNHVHELAEKVLEKSRERNEGWLLNKLNLEKTLNHHQKVKFQRGKKINFKDLMESLDDYYLVTKLGLCCEITNMQQILSIDFNPVMMEELLEHLRQTDYSNKPAIAIYYSIYQMLHEEESEPFFQNLRTLLLKFETSFTPEEMLGFYTYAINYCIRKANRGESGYLVQLFELYKTALERGFLYEKKILTHSNFKNIVTVGLQVGEFNYVHDFIENYKNSLEPEQRKNAYSYNLARYYYATRNFNKVLELLQTVEYADVFYNLGAKVMLLKVYYEEDEINALLSLIESFTVFLKRNTMLSENHKTNYLGFLKAIKKLVGTPVTDKAGLHKLRKQIAETKGMIDIKWLLEKTDEALGQRHKV